MKSAIQTDFLSPTLQQQFEAWKQTPGGAHVLRHAYRLAAGYAARWQRTGRQVSAKLIWELLRDRVTYLRAEFRRRGVALEKWDGFALNNIFTAYVARHVMEHRPEWEGMFELRTVGKARKTRKVIVIETDFPPVALNRRSTKGSELDTAAQAAKPVCCGQPGGCTV